MKTLLALLLMMSIFSKSYSSESLIAPIKSELASGEIKKVELYFLPYDFTTFVAVTPEMIKEMAVVIEIDASDPLIKKLSDTLEKVRCDVIEEQLDVRSGILFLDENGVELHSIYLNGKFFSGTGRKGSIDGRAVKLNGALQSWIQPLRKKFGAKTKAVEGNSL